MRCRPLAICMAAPPVCLKAKVFSLRKATIVSLCSACNRIAVVRGQEAPMPAHAQTSTVAIVTAGRRLLEERGMDALTMRDVAAAVGVRTPSLYKRVRGRSDLFGLILEDVADELTSALDAAASSGDPLTDVRAMAAAYRGFARA